MRLLVVACIILAWFAPNPAAACGSTPLSVTLLADDAGGVSAGTKLLRVYIYGTSLDTPPTVTLSADRLRASPPTRIPVTLRVAAPWLVEVELGSAAIQAGVSYTLNLSEVGAVGGGPGTSKELTFYGVEAKPMPSELGTLTLDERASGRIPVSGCGGPFEGEQVLIKLVPSVAAEPWLRGVKHQLYVDGQPAFEPEVPLVDYVARKSETVIRAWTDCTRTNVAGDVPYTQAIDLKLPVGEHKVRWSSTFPNGTTLETSSIDLDLRCAGATSAPAGVSVAADAGLNIATAVNLDSAPAADSGASDALEEQGCSLGGSQRGVTSGLGLLIALCLARTRAARQRKH